MSYFSIPRSSCIGEYLLDASANDTNDGTKTNGTATNLTYANTQVGYQKQHAVFGATSSFTRASLAGIQTLAVAVYPTAASKTLFTYVTTTGLVTFDGSYVVSTTGLTNATIYVNGVQASTLTANAWNLLVITHDAATATNFNLGSSSFLGNACMLRTFNAKLTETERLQLWHEFNRKLAGGSDFGAYVPSPEQYWPLLQDNVVADVINSVNATTNATNLSSDRFGIAKGLSFSSQKLEQSITTSDGSYTLAWVGSLTAPAADSSYYRIFDSQNNGSTTQGAPLALINNGAGVRIASYHQNGSWVTISNDLTSYLGSTRKWAYKFNGSNVYVYVDGVLIGSAAQSTNYLGWTGTARWMEKTTPSGSNVNGSLQECMRFGVALSDNQVKFLHDTQGFKYPYAFRSSFQNSFRSSAYLACPNATGTTAKDFTGNARDLSSTNSITVLRSGQDQVFDLTGATANTVLSRSLTGLSGTYAFGCWVNSRSTGTGQDRGAALFNNTTGFGWGWGDDFYVYGSGAKVTVSGLGGNVLRQKWQHIVVKYASGVRKCYVNGALVHSDATGDASTSGMIEFGKGNFPSVTYCPAWYAHPFFYNGDIPEDLIRQHYYSTYRN